MMGDGAMKTIDPDDPVVNQGFLEGNLVLERMVGYGYVIPE